MLIDGRAVDTADPREVRRALLSTAGARFAEIWLSVNGGCSMALLKSDDRALCLFVRHHGDPGFTSRRPRRENEHEDPRRIGRASPRRAARKPAEIEFHVGRGDSVRFPAEWTVPLFVALRAADEFLRTGEMPPQIPWHDDAKAPPASKTPSSTRKPRKRST